MMKRQWLLGALLCFGCDDGAGGGSGGPGGGVAGNKQFEDITVQELRSFCKWVTESEQEAVSVEQWCRIEASTDAADADECEELYDECLVEEEPLWESEYEEALEDCEAYEESDLPSDCPVAVSDVRKCYEDLVASLRSAGRAASCDEPGESADDEDPESCSAVDDACPWLTEDFAAQVVAGPEGGAPSRARRMFRRPN
jgi:hypothetical protein